MMIIRYGVGLIFLMVLYLIAWPVPIDPVTWQPPPAPALEGQYAVNDYLAAVEIIGKDDGIGPEDVDVDDAGRIYGAYEDGRIIRYSASGENLGVFADTKGRPLGLDFDSAGNLIIADAVKGLLSADKNGTIRVLATEIDGIPFGFTDDVDIGLDDMIYFSDASEKFGIHDYRADLFEHRPHGKILSYDPATEKLTLLLDGLYFANGVAVDPNGQFLLFNETYDYSVSKYWLQGPKTGSREKIFTNMPGFPDGISTGSKGIFWIAMYTPRNADADALAPKPFLRKIVFRLPLFMQPAPVRHGFVLGIDGNGNVIHNLQDPDLESYSPITSVEEENGVLYLGSLIYPGLARIKRPQ
mgnify:CR=1 FL=1